MTTGMGIGRGRLALLAAGAFLAGAAAMAAVKQSYRTVPAEFLATIAAAEDAFNRKDAAAVAPYLAEDYSWWQVTPEGAREAVRGRDATIALLGKFYQADTWIASEFERLGMVGNILVQVEEDTVLEGGKPVRKVTLNLYEFRDGKRWREWKFFPQGEGPGGNLPKP